MKHNPIVLLLLLMVGALLVVGQFYVTLPLVEALAVHWQVTLGQASVAPPIAHALALHGWLVLLLVPSAALTCAAFIVNGLPIARSRC